MDRRKFFFKGALGLGTMSVLSLTDLAKASDENTGEKQLIVCFHAGTAEASAADGSWDIVVMADPRLSQAPARIRLKFQVARNEAFDDLISEELYFAKKSNSYIVRVKYHPPTDITEFFYRFVAVDAHSPGARRQFSLEPTTTIPKRLSAQS